MTYPHGPPPPRPGERPRPVIGGREHRWRWWLMRVNLERQSYVFFHDVERYDWACLFADAAVRMGLGDWIVWDSEEKRALYDSRKIAAKFRDEAPTEKFADETPTKKDHGDGEQR